VATKADKSSKKKQKNEGTDGTPTSFGSKGSWKMLDRGATIASGLLATRVAMVAWQGVTGRKPPVNGRHPEVSTGEAVAWAAVGGAVVELVKVGVRRGATTYWVRSTGHLPPGMKSIKSDDTALQEAAAKGRRSQRRKKKG
jgi:hypothetical protein